MTADRSDANRPDPYSSIKTKAPIRFINWNGSEYPASLTNITYRGEDSIIKVVITMSVHANVLRQLLAEQSFHTLPHALTAAAQFEEDEPIELKAMLNPAIAKQIEEQQGDAETVLAALLPAEAISPEASSLARTSLAKAEYWFLLQAMQNLTLPPELQHTGTARQGFRTIWQSVLTEQSEESASPAPANDLDMPSSTTSGSPFNLLMEVENVLKTENLSYERFSEDIIRVPFKDDSGSWVLLIRIDQELNLLNLYSVFPERIPASKRSQIALMLINEHYNFTSGNFEMDIEDGEVRFRSTLNCTTSWDDELFRSLLGDHLKIVEIYFPLLQHLR